MERLSTAVYARGPCFIRNSNDVDKDWIEWGVSKTGRTCRALCPGVRKYLELGCARASTSFTDNERSARELFEGKPEVRGVAAHNANLMTRLLPLDSSGTPCQIAELDHKLN